MLRKVSVKVISYFVVSSIIITAMVSGFFPGAINKTSALIIPSGSTELATGMTVDFAATIYSPAISGSFTNGVIDANTVNSTGTGTFNVLGIADSDTYVYSAIVKMQDPYSRMGFVFRGTNMDWKNMFSFNSDNTIGIYESGYFDGSNRTNNMIAQSELSIKGISEEINHEYLVTIKSWPDKVSVWIDEVLVFDQVSIGGNKKFLAGVWLENSIITMKNISIFKDSSIANFPGVDPLATPTVQPSPTQSPIIPAKPADSLNYAKDMTVGIDSSLDATYIDGVLTNTANGSTNSVLFNDIPLLDSDTYVYSADITFKETTENWQAPRMIFKYVNTDWFLCLGFIGDQAVILQRGYIDNILEWKILAQTTFTREIGKKYTVGILSSPDKVSIWIDGLQIMGDVATPRYTTRMGVLFTNGSAVMENFNIYNTIVVPQPPAPPSIPVKPAGTVNLANSMYVAIDGGLDAKYENGILKNITHGGQSPAFFQSIPLAKNNTYVISASVTMHGDANTLDYLGVRLIVRMDDSNNYACLAFFKDKIVFLDWKNGAWEGIDAPAYTYAREFGKEYKVIVRSEPTKTSVWLDGKNIFNQVTLPAYGANTGVLFSDISAEIKDIVIYKDLTLANGNPVTADLFNFNFAIIIFLIGIMGCIYSIVIKRRVRNTAKKEK